MLHRVTCSRLLGFVLGLVVGCGAFSIVGHRPRASAQDCNLQGFHCECGTITCAHWTLSGTSSPATSWENNNGWNRIDKSIRCNSNTIFAPHSTLLYEDGMVGVVTCDMGAWCNNHTEPMDHADYQRSVTVTIGYPDQPDGFQIKWEPLFASAVDGWDKICCGQDGQNGTIVAEMRVKYTLETAGCDSFTRWSDLKKVTVTQTLDGDGCYAPMGADCTSVPVVQPDPTSFLPIYNTCCCVEGVSGVINTFIELHFEVQNPDGVGLLTNSTLESWLKQEKLTCTNQ